MIPVETWFPVVTLLAGTAIGGVLEALRDNRAGRREKLARVELRAETDRLRRLEFQKATLLELQDHYTIAVRQIGQIHHHQMKAFYQALQQDSWGASPLPSALDSGVLSTMQQVGKLRVRVADESLRRMLSELNSIYADICLAKSEQQSQTLIMRMPNLVEGLNDRMGELLRST